MILRYLFGHPFDTEAVPNKPAVSDGPVPYLSVENDGSSLSMTLSDDDVVYGLGETVRGMNKRGWIYVSYNTDEFLHTETTKSLYASQNFLLVTNGLRSLGIFVDCPGEVTFDIGYTKMDRLCIRPAKPDFELYLVTSAKMDPAAARRDVVHHFRRLIGKSYLPPLFAFGYGQSRWGYKSEDDVEEVADSYERMGVPLDAIYLDIDYMDHFKDFTVNEETFPDFPGFVSRMKDRGIHLVPIIDAGIRKEEGYCVYEEGKKNGHFVKDKDGKDFTAAVWPGEVCFPDVLSSRARQWFGSQYDVLLDAGIDGFWNDMNEPSIFYTPERLNQAIRNVAGYEGKDLDVNAFMRLRDEMGTLSNNREDYRNMVHDADGTKVCHDDVHNLYGFNMTRAAGEHFLKACGEGKVLLFSRSSYIGMHRYGGVWTGDNRTWWSHLKLSLQQQPALNMAGFLYSGSDMGGFMDDTTEDLMLRWLSASLFTPLYRNHAALGTREKELYRFPHRSWFENLVQLRYALIPYIYAQFRKARDEDAMYLAPLSFFYGNDERVMQIEDQLMAGEDVMIAPVVEQNKKGRMVYLPEDMTLVRFRSFEDYDTVPLAKGDHYVSCALNEALVFIRKGHVLPLGVPAANTAELDLGNLTQIRG